VRSTSTNNGALVNVDKKLLDILVCPVTKGALIYDRDKQELISRSARLAYPIRDGIPVMLEDEARRISEEEYERLKPRA
jgi:uncharacterized protein YbaR (Trm112 family)